MKAYLTQDMIRIGKMAAHVTISCIVAAAFSFLMCLPMWALWNAALVSAVDFVNPITVWQAWGITFLVGILRTNHSYEVTNQSAPAAGN